MVNLAAPIKQGSSWICRLCGQEYINPLAHSCSLGSSAPVLTGDAANEFLKIIKENENKKISKEDYERARNAYKNFKVI